MNIIKGQSRIAIIIGNLVFKFPRIFPLITALRASRFLTKGKSAKKAWRIISHMFKFAIIKILFHVKQNFNEYLLWRKLSPPFMPKTYFSLGIINIQAFVKGEHPTQRELWDIFAKIDKRTNNERRQVSTHCFDRKNIVKTKNGLMLVDGGDTNNKPGIPLDVFILKWHKVITEEFSRTS